MTLPWGVNINSVVLSLYSVTFGHRAEVYTCIPVRAAMMTAAWTLHAAN